MNIMYFQKIVFFLILIALSKNLLASPWIEGNKVVIQGLDKITARIETFEVFIGQTHRFGVLDIFVERCVFSKPIFKPESLAFIRIMIILTGFLKLSLKDGCLLQVLL